MAEQTTKLRRERIVVDVASDVRWDLKRIANEKRMSLKEFLDSVFHETIKRNPPRSSDN